MKCQMPRRPQKDVAVIQIITKNSFMRQIDDKTCIRVNCVSHLLSKGLLCLKYMLQMQNAIRHSGSVSESFLDAGAIIRCFQWTTGLLTLQL